MIHIYRCHLNQGCLASLTCYNCIHASIGEPNLNPAVYDKAHYALKRNFTIQSIVALHVGSGLPHMSYNPNLDYLFLLDAILII